MSVGSRRCHRWVKGEVPVLQYRVCAMLTLPYDFRLLSGEPAGVTHIAPSRVRFSKSISVTNEGMWAGLHCVSLRSALDRSIIAHGLANLIWINALDARAAFTFTLHDTEQEEG